MSNETHTDCPLRPDSSCGDGLNTRAGELRFDDDERMSPDVAVVITDPRELPMTIWAQAILPPRTANFSIVPDHGSQGAQLGTRRAIDLAPCKSFGKGSLR